MKGILVTIMAILCIGVYRSANAQIGVSARGGAIFVMPEKYGYSTAYNMTGNFGIEINYKNYFAEYFNYNIFYSYTSVLEDLNNNTVLVEGQRWFGTAHNFKLGRMYYFKELIFKYSATFAFVSDDQYVYSLLPQLDSDWRDANINFLSAEFEIKIPLVYGTHFFFGGGPHYMVDWNSNEYLSATIFTGLSYDFTFHKKK